MADPKGIDVPMTRALMDVMIERERQKQVLGWTFEHDDAHTDRSLSFAAAAYMFIASQADEYVVGWNELGWRDNSVVANFLWPAKWHWKYWKPRTGEEGRRENLVRSLALGLAELERLDRLDAKHAAEAGARGG